MMATSLICSSHEVPHLARLLGFCRPAISDPVPRAFTHHQNELKTKNKKPRGGGKSSLCIPDPKGDLSFGICISTRFCGLAKRNYISASILPRTHQQTPFPHCLAIKTLAALQDKHRFKKHHCNWDGEI